MGIMLSPREIELLQLLSAPAGRHDNKYLAYKMGIATGTTKQYLFRVGKKLNLDRVGLALWGQDVGIIDYDCKETEISTIRSRSPRPSCNQPASAQPTTTSTNNFGGIL